MKKAALICLVVVFSIFVVSKTQAKAVDSSKGKTQLTFTFNSPNVPWTSGELEILKSWIAVAYPETVSVFGAPSESQTVNIEKNLQINGGLTNPTQIILGTFSAETFTHELVHAFAGSNGPFAATYREGMAVAVSSWVMNSLPNEPFGNRHHGGQREVMYEQTKSESIGSVEGNFQNGFSNRGLRYEQSGYGWNKLILEDPKILAKFNKVYYPAAKVDPYFFLNTEAIKKIFRDLKPKVEGKPFDDWYSEQQVFNTNPSKGLQLVYSAGDYAAFVFNRDADGKETMLSGANVNWIARDCYGTSLNGGTVATDELGWARIPTWDLGASYGGKVNLFLSVSVGGQTMEREIALPAAINGTGVFGVAKTCSGSVELNLPSGKSLKAEIFNGSFSFPEAMSAGTYVIKSSAGEFRFTKDGSYFVYSP